MDVEGSPARLGMLRTKFQGHNTNLCSREKSKRGRSIKVAEALYPATFTHGLFPLFFSLAVPPS